MKNFVQFCVLMPFCCFATTPDFSLHNETISVRRAEQVRSERALFEASNDTFVKKQETRIREVLSDYLGSVRDVKAAYSQCFSTDALNRDRDFKSLIYYRYEGVLEASRVLINEGIIPQSFFSLLEYGEKVVAEMLCDFWNNQDLVSTLINDSIEANNGNGQGYFHFLNYLLFEKNPKADEILKLFDSFSFFDELVSGDPFAVFESLFPNILTGAREGDWRCKECLFHLRGAAIVRDEYKPFWDIVKRDETLMNSILDQKLSDFGRKGIFATSRVLGL
ncbi:MAG: hypothetical protein K5780_00645 [Alphaproteobacteria bacterium]|nr:hypothetical protein [Alphaproteobacteria bacterium]